jgi:hypothetical protein
MPLLNYTTSVAVAKTMAEIHRILVTAGARSIATSYDAQARATGVTFSTDTPFGVRGFTMPVNVEQVYKVLWREKIERRYKTREHAERVAWRIVKDWLEAQVAIIRTEMVTLDQVMLPYMQGGDGRTVYDLYRDQQLALPAAPDDRSAAS